MTPGADLLAELSEAARTKAARIIADVGAWAGELQDVKTAPDPGGIMVTMCFEGGIIAFVAPNMTPHDGQD